MSDQPPPIDTDSIVVGKPIPFSVYGADRNLLLAKGCIVESERVREMLVASGKFQDSISSVDLWLDEDGAADAQAIDPLMRYAQHFAADQAQSRVGIRMARNDAADNHACWIMGADEQHGLIITAPMQADGTMLPIAVGEQWVFRLLYLTAACRFAGTIASVQTQSVPLLTVSLPKQVEMRHIRSSPRVGACLHASLKIGRDLPALITDLSVGGVCVAIAGKQGSLRLGQKLMLSFTLRVLNTDYSFKVPAVVMNLRSDRIDKYPDLLFAGLKIEAQSDMERLVLHSYVFERSVKDFNPLWKTLLAHKT
ncbi:MAG: flagellar brake domain-containing protein [Steroidobacteraceae bacterium]